MGRTSAARRPDRTAPNGTKRTGRHGPTGLISQRSLVQIQPAQRRHKPRSEHVFREAVCLGDSANEKPSEISRPQIDRRYPFAEIPAAIAYLEQGRRQGEGGRGAGVRDLPSSRSLPLRGCGGRPRSCGGGGLASRTTGACGRGLNAGMEMLGLIPQRSLVQNPARATKQIAGRRPGRRLWSPMSRLSLWQVWGPIYSLTCPSLGASGCARSP